MWLGKRMKIFVKQAWSFEIEGSRGRGRPRLAWKGMMENFCCGLGLDLEDVMTVKWRKSVRSWKEVSDPLEKEKMMTIIK